MEKDRPPKAEREETYRERVGSAERNDAWRERVRRAGGADLIERLTDGITPRTWVRSQAAIVSLVGLKIGVRSPEVGRLQDMSHEDVNALVARAQEVLEPGEVALLAFAVVAIAYEGEMDVQLRPKPPITPESF